MAFVEAVPTVKGTVVLTGHYDVVGAEDFGSLEDLAFSPLEYTSALKERGLDGEAGGISSRATISSAEGSWI
jgi:arginine utilization protein RocB